MTVNVSITITEGRGEEAIVTALPLTLTPNRCPEDAVLKALSTREGDAARDEDGGSGRIGGGTC